MNCMRFMQNNGKLLYQYNPENQLKKKGTCLKIDDDEVLIGVYGTKDE